MIDAYITEVEGVSLREVTGAGGPGGQVELQIRRKGRQDLTVRLIGRKGKPIRVTDLRGRDRSKKTRLMTVPFEEIVQCK